LHGLVQLRDGDLQVKRGQQTSSDVNGYRSSGDRNDCASRHRTGDNGSDVQVNWSTMGCGILQTRQGQQWVCDDRVEVDRQVLDKSMALSGALCAEGCYATLPNTVMVLQHQQSTVKDNTGGDISVHGAQPVRQQLLYADEQSGVSGCDPQLSSPRLRDSCGSEQADYEERLVSTPLI